MNQTGIDHILAPKSTTPLLKIINDFGIFYSKKASEKGAAPFFVLLFFDSTLNKKFEWRFLMGKINCLVLFIGLICPSEK